MVHQSLHGLDRLQCSLSIKLPFIGSVIISFINSPTETRVKYFLQRPSSKHKHCSEFSHLKGRRQFSSWSQLLPCVLQQKTFWGAVIRCRVFKHRPFLTSFQPCLKSEFFSFTTFSLKSVTVQTTRNRKCKWLERSTRENSDLRMNCVCEVGVNLHSKVSKRLCCWKNEGGWGRRGRERGWWCLHSSSKLVEKILIVIIYISYTDE